MADYITDPQIDESTSDQQQDRRELILSEGGGVAARAFYHIRDHDFAIGHDFHALRLAALLSHYRSNASIAFNFTYQQDSVVYLVRYAGIPIWLPSEACDYFIASVRFKEVSA